MEKFVDAFVIGEGTLAMKKLVKTFERNKQKGTSIDKLENELLSIPGVYMPSIYKFEYNGTKLTNIQPEFKVDFQRTLHLAGTRRASLFTKPHRAIILMDYSCKFKCNYCQMSHARGSYDYWDKENVLRYLLEFDSIGITTTTLSSATATNLPQELFFSVYQWAKKNLKMTKPVIRSVRADKFPEIFHLLEQDRIILAPETASEFLRNQVLEKWITNNQINECFEILMNNDVPSMRLYYIVGIPGETEKDRKDFVQLVELASKYVNNIQVVMFPLLMQAGTPFEQFGSIGLDTFNDYYNDFCTWIDRSLY